QTTGAGGQAAPGDASPPATAAANLTVPNLTEDFVTALLASIGVATPEEMMGFLRQHGPDGLRRLRVAFRAPPLPPYYQTEPGRDMDLSVEIDRGDVWYDFPFDARGRQID